MSAGSGWRRGAHLGVQGRGRQEGGGARQCARVGNAPVLLAKEEDDRGGGGGGLGQLLGRGGAPGKWPEAYLSLSFPIFLFLQYVLI